MSSCLNWLHFSEHYHKSVVTFLQHTQVIGTLSRKMKASPAFIHLPRYVFCSPFVPMTPTCYIRVIMVHNTGRWCTMQLFTVEVVHSVGSTKLHTPYCTTQVVGAQRRLMVYNAALYQQGGAQGSFHNPLPHTHTQMDPILLPLPLMREVIMFMLQVMRSSNFTATGTNPLTLCQ